MHVEGRGPVETIEAYDMTRYGYNSTLSCLLSFKKWSELSQKNSQCTFPFAKSQPQKLFPGINLDQNCENKIAQGGKLPKD